MSDHMSATDRSYRQDSAGGSYFAPLAQARYLLLTTFRQKGASVSVRAQGIIDGDRAYFRTWSRSGTVKRLREANAVQVTPCDVLGLCRYGPPLNAAARLLADEEASRIAGHLHVVDASQLRRTLHVHDSSSVSTGQCVRRVLRPGRPSPQATTPI